MITVNIYLIAAAKKLTGNEGERESRGSRAVNGPSNLYLMLKVYATQPFSLQVGNITNTLS